ncbi:phosphoenolpyruvate carboxykinase (GTP) [Paeniglutamicibacter terrestris]|uniref:Phosphoenolpyruvate carboxykinase [GTP] n=1 Tax=Paeniglutamicibacter terrestris TaxID=2723403 RepID=A0ABX1G7N7_9MICC|nr:phosphoenolpyruvate carboxykinase (GTP) [Paeniglutamicibacter terrestris]NKG22029.1 phosphoenolpyruvate carboxykinase (GTP) [Paeniglutamicibacter terrestris]
MNSFTEPAVRGFTPHAPASLLQWVDQVAAMTTPEKIHWVDGSAAEYRELTDELVGAGTLVRLAEEKFPHSFAAFSDPDDVARVEEQTFICSEKERDAGFTNNWMDPAIMKEQLRKLFTGSMRGRTMYVIPFVMGHLESQDPKFGVEITDSAYVVASMHIMTRSGADVLAKMNQLNADFVPALHSVGAPLEPGQQDVSWPCNREKWIVHFPEEKSIWSYGSGYGGNALLGKKCYSLRIASAMARQEGWLAEHMLILKLTNPEGQSHFISAAFPSACGKTNLALLNPTVKGWRVETLGDDIAWIRVGKDGRLRATNPEAGLFGVAPGTGWRTNPNAMDAITKGNTIFTNVALTDDGGVWWEGMTEETPEHLRDWTGKDWTPASGKPAAHPNSRFCTPISQVEILAAEYEDPEGVPLSAIFFGGRRKTTIPLVTQSRDWTSGVFMGSTLSSETTAAAAGKVGVVRRDPMAMLPFIGYDAGDYLQHWLDVGTSTTASKLPQIFLVNWFRRDAAGKFLWPGFGENSRVLKWAIERIEGTAAGVETPIGYVPAPGALDTTALSVSNEDLGTAMDVDPDEWDQEIESIKQWYARFGDSLPTPLSAQLDGLTERFTRSSSNL